MRAKVRNLLVVLVSLFGVCAMVVPVSAHSVLKPPSRLGEGGISKVPWVPLPGSLPAYEIVSLSTTPDPWQSTGHITITLRSTSTVSFSNPASGVQWKYDWPAKLTFELQEPGLSKPIIMTGTLPKADRLGALTESYDVPVPSVSGPETALLTVASPMTVTMEEFENGVLSESNEVSVETTGASSSVTLIPFRGLENKTPKSVAGDLPEIPMAGAFPALLAIVAAGTWLGKKKKPEDHRQV